MDGFRKVTLNISILLDFEIKPTSTTNFFMLIVNLKHTDSDFRRQF